MNHPHLPPASPLNFAGLLVFLVLIAPATRAATINLSALNDTLSNNDACSIRQAVINANNNAATSADCTAGSGADVINLPAGTVTLSIPNTPQGLRPFPLIRAQ